MAEFYSTFLRLKKLFLGGTKKKITHPSLLFLKLVLV